MAHVVLATLEGITMRQRLARLLGSACVSAVVFIGLVLGLSTSASAVAIYSYTGNPYTTIFGSMYTSSMYVTATMTLSNPIAPNQSKVDLLPELISLTMFDGVQTLDSSNLSLNRIAVASTDSAGKMTDWQVWLFVAGGPIGIATMTPPSGPLVLDQVNHTPEDNASVRDNAGSWAVVPEPTTVTLLALGLVAMAGVRRRNV